MLLQVQFGTVLGSCLSSENMPRGALFFSLHSVKVFSLRPFIVLHITSPYFLFSSTTFFLNMPTDIRIKNKFEVKMNVVFISTCFFSVDNIIVNIKSKQICVF